MSTSVYVDPRQQKARELAALLAGQTLRDAYVIIEYMKDALLDTAVSPLMHVPPDEDTIDDSSNPPNGPGTPP